MSTVSFTLVADADDFISAMQQSEAAAKRTERAGDKLTASTKRTGSESKKAATLLQAMKEAAEGVGGKAGESAGKVEKFSKALGGVGSAVGPLGIGLGIAGGALAAMGAVAVKAALQTTSLVEELQKAGKAVPIDDAQLAQVRSMDREIEGLKDDFKRLAVTLGAEVAPAIGSMVSGFRSAFSAVQDLTERVEGFRRVLLGVVSLGGSELWNWWSSPAEGAGDYAEKVRESKERLDELTAGHDQIGRVARRTTEDMSQGWGAVKAKIDAAATASGQLESMYIEDSEALLSEEERLIAAYDRRIAKIGELVTAGGDQFAAAAARAAAETKMQRDLSALEQQRVSESTTDYTSAMWAKAEASNELAEVELANQEARRAAEIEGTLGTLAAIESIANTFSRSQKGMTEAQKQAALVGFRISQAAAIAQIAISTAVATSKAFESYGPTPAGYLMAAAMLGQGAAQGAAVAAEPPPSFSQGGMVEPDHRVISASPGEGVLTQSGVANVGGPDGVAALNQGRTTGNQVVIRFGHKFFDAVASEHLDRDGPIAQRITQQAGPIGHTLVNP